MQTVTHVISEVTARLPTKRKITPNGWVSFNAPCCHLRGHLRPDTKMRGGFKTTPTSFSYHCFNCNFKATWVSGHGLNKKVKEFLGYLGIPEIEINKLNLLCLKTTILSQKVDDKSKQLIQQNSQPETNFLPENAKSFSYWIDNLKKLTLTEQEDFLSVVNYLKERNEKLLEYHEYFWSPTTKYRMNKRVIIPFKNNTWIYGYSARYIFESKKITKYITQHSPNYIFGQQFLYSPYRKYAILCEGIFDAISVSGLAVMRQDLSKEQIEVLKASNKEIIVLPDRDSSGKALVEQAINNNFSVSMPDWDKNIKDAADAVKMYGRLPVVRKIIETAENNKFKIKLAERFWFNGKN